MEQLSRLSILYESRHLRFELRNHRTIKDRPWRAFEVRAVNRDAHEASRPTLEVVFISVTAEGAFPWIECTYDDELVVAGRATLLSENGIAESLFVELGRHLPPGGHFMITYEGTQGVHRETISGLKADIPPFVTPLGFLLFKAGCLTCHDWYWPEGWMEGARKLRGQKPPDETYRRRWSKDQRRELREFIRTAPGKKSPMHRAAVERAKRILQELV